MEIIKFDHKITNFKTENFAIFIFGVGLIGGSIKDLLLRRFTCEVVFCDFCWDPTLDQQLNFDLITEHFQHMAKTSRIHFVYSAGKSGMLSENVYSQEIDSFLQVVNIVKLSAQFVGSGRITFHLLSSAGGLFEGQLNVDENSIPNPLSQYGQIKLKQENVIKNCVGQFNVVIYRPSSVYGYRSKSRLGLVSTILTRANKNLGFEVFASKDSIRDYVFIDDISNFIVNHFIQVDNIDVYKEFFLVSGKPTSIGEMLDILNRIYNKKLYYYYKVNKQNTLNMSFRKTLIPDGFLVTSLFEGVLKTKMTIR
jgi:nucleoside-diphosphate-sugar epimerase